MEHTATMSAEMRTAIESCMTCSAMCEQTIAYCMDMPGTMMDPKMMRIMMDCAEMTKLCADMMCRMSPMAGEMCGMCMRMCMMCAEMCEKMPDDAQMMKLAQMCRSCADSCRAMSTVAA